MFRKFHKSKSLPHHESLLIRDLTNRYNHWHATHPNILKTDSFTPLTWLKHCPEAAEHIKDYPTFCAVVKSINKHGHKIDIEMVTEKLFLKTIQANTKSSSVTNR